MNPVKKISMFALAGAATIAVGCGDSGPTAEDAKKAYAPVDTSLTKLGSDIENAVTSASGKTDAALATQFDDLSEETTSQVADIKAIEVPEDLVDERDALASAVEDAQGDLADIASAAEAGNVTAATNATRSLLAHAKVVGDANDAFDKALNEATS